MAFCRNCGNDIGSSTTPCGRCGNPIKEIKNEPNSVLWGILGYFIPIAGLILYLIWKEEKPKSSKAAGIGALISFTLGAIFVFIYIMLFVMMISFMSY